MKILVTGPESSGKTYTAQKLARQYNFLLVPEYARTYLEIHGPDYTYDDLVIMSQAQHRFYSDHESKSYIMDTYLINYKIWFQKKYESYPEFLDEALINSYFDLVLLMSPDIDWEYDPLRENRFDRDKLFSSFEKELKYLEWPYHIISGNKESRLEKCKKLINDCMIDLN